MRDAGRGPRVTSKARAADESALGFLAVAVFVMNSLQIDGVGAKAVGYRAMPRNTNDFPSTLIRARRLLHAWYRAHGRHDLPWRTTRDPYTIYVSEVMLQQTQVATVREHYYAPFLAKFPTLAALAAARKEDVMKAWEGLGYYTRAANLQRAAQECVARHGGALPGTPEALLALPGIGRNTAHAVASFAFGARLPILEANVKRVVHRVFALKEANADTLWARAGDLLGRRDPFAHNQSMMDLGALICTAKAPRCGICPLASACRGKRAPERYPAARAKKAKPVRKRIIVAFADARGGYFLARRDGAFLHGLYGFPEYAADATPVKFAGRAYPLKRCERVGAVRQVYSHFALEAQVYRAQTAARPDATWRRASLAEMAALPLSRADRKVVALLAAREEERAASAARVA